MRKPLVSLAILLLLSLSTGGCGGSSTPVDPLVERQISEDLEKDAASVVEAANEFAVDLYQELRSLKEGNLFFSPFSASTALTMTYAGAAGETAEEMAGVLHLDGSGENIGASYGALVASLDRGGDLGGYRLNVANRLWGQVDYTFLETFLAICDDHYQAGLEELDFLADPDGSRQTINTWVEEKTEGKIQDLLPPGSVSALTRLVLTNAIYFKGDWASQFDKRETSDAPFYLAGGGSVDVPMMFQEMSCRYLSWEDFSMVELPYKGKDLSMLLLLPDETDGLPALEEQLTAEDLETWRASLGEATVRVYLPRFEVATEYPLSQNLAAMGMPSAFDPMTADFSGMTGTKELFIHGVYHKAYVKVNEEGTEAAAATGVVVGTTSIPEYPVFRADHPFLFLIRDNVTGSILFMGRMADPSA
jgi:serpin B